MNLKECKCCKQTKDKSQFHTATGMSDGYRIVCKSCARNKQLSRPDYEESHRRALLKKQYGITLEEYHYKLKEQDGKCAICGNGETALSKNSKRVKSLAVDHCHTTGKVRGLLCHACNMVLGYAKDNVNNLHNAAKYLLETA
jgi:hypothetical protein